MDSELIFGFLIFGFFAVGTVAVLVTKSYRLFNHHKWENYSVPDENAKIKNVSQERVNNGRELDKLKTTISFTDGFQFITYKTEYERVGGFFSNTYRLSIDTDEVLRAAKDAHANAVLKKRKSSH